MKFEFFGHFSLTDLERDRVWRDGLIVFDTNSLLNLYRYKQDTLEEFFELLENFKRQLWLPYQVGIEFFTRRLSVISSEQNRHDGIRSTIQNAKESIEKEVERLSRFEEEKSTKIINALIGSLEKALDDLQEIERVRNERLSINAGGMDPILARLARVYEGKVGQPFTVEEGDSLEEEGERRYTTRQPPGYLDEVKDRNKFGDLAIWKQILKACSEEEPSRPCIFVTDDSKEDWWLLHKGRKLGPRPELVEEFVKATGHQLLFYSPSWFLEQAKSRDQAVSVSRGSIGDVSAVSERQTENEITIKKINLERRQIKLSVQRANYNENIALIREDLMALERLEYRAEKLDREKSFLLPELLIIENRLGVLSQSSKEDARNEINEDSLRQISALQAKRDALSVRLAELDRERRATLSARPDYRSREDLNEMLQKYEVLAAKNRDDLEAVSARLAADNI